MSKKFDFTSLVAAEKQESIDDLAEYQELLREIARDACERSESEILRILERCGRETSDLQTDMEWRVKRDEQIAELNRETEYREQNDEPTDAKNRHRLTVTPTDSPNGCPVPKPDLLVQVAKAFQRMKKKE